MSVTPAIAQQWLTEKNHRNRNLTQHRVKQYADDMASGKWYETHQGIAFYESGDLADGQHRLAAIAQSGVCVDMIVTFGVSDSASIGIDAHRARHTKDQIKISGENEWVCSRIASMVKMDAVIKGDTSGNMSVSRLIELAQLSRESYEFVVNAIPTKTKYITITPVMYAIASAYGQVDTVRLTEFCKVISTGVMGSMDDIAAIRLRERLISTNQVSGTAVRAAGVRVSMRAIKAFVDRQQIGKLFVPEEYIYELQTY